MMSPNDPTHSASEPHAHHTATVRLSLSEINALCFKAARGAGLTWGEAEEAGWAAAWLSRAGLAGPSAILAWLHEAATLARPAPSPGHWAAQGRALCPLRTGAALADFAGLPEGPGAKHLTITDVAHPLIILPFVARAAGRVDLLLRMRWGKTDVVLDASGPLPGMAMSAKDCGEPAQLTITPFGGRARTETTRQDGAPVGAVAFDHCACASFSGDSLSRR